MDNDPKYLLLVLIGQIIWGALTWAVEHWQVLLMIFAAYFVANVLIHICGTLQLILDKLEEKE